MHIGVDYYPEHWPQARWATDAGLMQKAGFTVVRLAEFSWALLEPDEGRFDFSWLDEALSVLRQHGIRAILGTPTASLPAWAARKYPEVMAADRAGLRATWGVRKNNCLSAGAWRMLSERVTAAMAGHYGGSDDVIGWQTDNEFGGPVCFCATCSETFRDWLKARYGSVETVNRAWGTHFWAHRYSDWEEIVLPDDPSAHNPGLCLDHRRFHSWLNVRVQADQVRILRTACPKHFVTHNFMGLFPDLDYRDLARDLDFVSWDNYPIWGAPEVHADAAAAADLMRGLKKKNFWIMEQTAGPGGWGVMGRNPRDGEIRQVAFQQVAHGADGILWFRWRTCTAGREQYWHGLLGHDGKPGRRYAEAARTTAELHRLAPGLQGTTVKASAAIIYDYDSMWAFRIQPAYPVDGAGPLDGVTNYQNAIRRWHRAFLRAGIGVDMAAPGDDISGYGVVCAPHLYVLPDATATALADWTRKGGVLITDCRTGVKDETSLAHERTLPGLLSGPLGISIEEYEALAPDMHYTVAAAAPGMAGGTSFQFADWVTAGSAETLAGYADAHMKTFAAATRNRFGAGWGYYVGTNVREGSFYDAILADAAARAGTLPALRPPVGVEISTREGAGKRLLFVINHAEEERTAEGLPDGEDLLTGQVVKGTLRLPGFGVAVIRPQPAGLRSLRT